MSRKMKLPIPLTIITGTLGVGKTTVLCNLVQQKPEDEVWCVIVNEFGAVGVDAVTIESAGEVTVKQIAGGCMCCVLSGPLSAAVAQVIRQVKPGRVIIEPSGLGHPGGLIDVLQGPHLCTSLQLNAIICLVDLTTFDATTLMSNSTAADHIMVGDILVGTKADAAPAGAAERFKAWANEELFPPKAEVLVTSHGQLSTTLLDAPRSAVAEQLLVRSSKSSSRTWGQRIQHHQHRRQQGSGAASEINVPVDAAAHAQGQGSSAASGKPLPRQPQPVMGATDQGENRSCGWVFDQQDMFDKAKLLQLLQELQPHVVRIKGVFRVGSKQWVVPAMRRQSPPQGHNRGTAAVVADSGHWQSSSSQREDSSLGGSTLEPASAMQDTTAQVATPHSNNEDSSSQSSKQRLEWRPICYRGPSIVEVVICAIPNDEELANLLLHKLESMMQLPNGVVHGSEHAVQQDSNYPTATSAGTRGAPVDVSETQLFSSDHDPCHACWDALQKALVNCLQQ